MVSGCAYNSERPSSMNAPTQQTTVQNGNGNANGGPTACMNINEQTIETGYDSTVAEGVGVGALVGAGLGALFGVLAGGDGKSAAIGAGVGAAAGGVYGAADGAQTARAKQRYAVQEAQLDCQLVAAKADNAKTATLVAGMRASVADTEKQLAQLEQDFAAKRLSIENAQRELASIDEGTEQLRRSMAALQKRRDEYKHARDTTQQSANNSLDSQELDRQIALLNSQIAAAEQDLNRLLDKRKVAQVG
jgi:archaellum component FlaC